MVELSCKVAGTGVKTHTCVSSSALWDCGGSPKLGDFSISLNLWILNFSPFSLLDTVLSACSKLIIQSDRHAERSRSISTASSGPFNEAVEMLRQADAR